MCIRNKKYVMTDLLLCLVQSASHLSEHPEICRIGYVNAKKQAQLEQNIIYIYKRQPLPDTFKFIIRKKIPVSFSVLRSKPLSCQSAEDRETQVTLTTTKRRTSTSHKQKSVQKSLLSSSECARVPPGLACFWKFALSWGLRWSRGVICSKQMPRSFIPHSWMRSFLPWFCVQLALTYTQAHYADTPCAATQKNTRPRSHLLSFCLLVFMLATFK